MKISIIIPTFNEEGYIGRLLEYLKKLGNQGVNLELIVVDGGSNDKTVKEALDFGAIVESCQKGRANQMNHGAKVSNGEVLYFLHADTYPPKTLITDIKQALDANYFAGCYAMKFDINHWFLALNAWFSKFNVRAFRYGDQSLFITKELFVKIKGFNQKLILMEDNDIVSRIMKVCKFKILPSRITTSARKYQDHGIFNLQFGYYKIYIMYRLGVSQSKLIDTYKKLLC